MARADRRDFTFAMPLRVRWAEVDMQGVVFNAHYLTYLDTAVTEYWRAVGFPYPAGLVSGGTDIFVVKATLEFHASARFDDVLEVACRAARLGRTSLAMEVGMWRHDELLVTGENIYVNVALTDRKSAPWPEALRSAVTSFEGTAPTG